MPWAGRPFGFRRAAETSAGPLRRGLSRRPVAPRLSRRGEWSRAWTRRGELLRLRSPEITACSRAEKGTGPSVCAPQTAQGAHERLRCARWAVCPRREPEPAAWCWPQPSRPSAAEQGALGSAPHARPHLGCEGNTPRRYGFDPALRLRPGPLDSRFRGNDGREERWVEVEGQAQSRRVALYLFQYHIISERIVVLPDPSDAP